MPEEYKTKSNAEKVLESLKREYFIIGKTRVRGWRAWFIIGILAGIVASIAFIANRSLKFEQSGAAVTGRVSKPNIVLILADDMGYSHYGFMGHPKIKTPNMDALVADGVLFPVTHDSASMCVPAFETVLTGRYPKDFKTKKQQYGRDILTIPAALSRAGYITYGAGKFWSGFKQAGFQYYTKHKRDSIGRVTMQPVYDFLDSHLARYPDKPFFLWYAPKLPHKPFDPPQRFRDLYASDPTLTSEEIAFYGNITRLDATIGDLVSFLKSRGVRDNTLLLYVVDNGLMLKNAKFHFSENGYRTVLWANLPGAIAQGLRRNEMAHTIDILPTFMDFAGLTIPRNLEGRSLKPLLEGKSVEWRKYLFGQNYRSSTKRTRVTSRYLRSQDGMKFYSEENRLYNLASDPDEEANLYNDYDKNFPGLIAKFRKAIEAWTPLDGGKVDNPEQELDKTRQAIEERIRKIMTKIEALLNGNDLTPEQRTKLEGFWLLLRESDLCGAADLDIFETYLKEEGLYDDIIPPIIDPLFQEAQCPKPSITHDLRIRKANDRNTGGQVSALQSFLWQFRDYYSWNLGKLFKGDFVTGSFGRKTKEAVIHFQEEFNAVSKGDSEYGMVGPKTREAILAQCTATPAPLNLAESSTVPGLRCKLDYMCRDIDGDRKNLDPCIGDALRGLVGTLGPDKVVVTETTEHHRQRPRSFHNIQKAVDIRIKNLSGSERRAMQEYLFNISRPPQKEVFGPKSNLCINKYGKRKCERGHRDYIHYACSSS